MTLRSRVVLVAKLASAALFSQAAFSQPTVLLENAQLRVTLSSENGSVQSVERAGQSYLGSAVQAGWYRIQIPLAYWPGHSAASAEQRTVTVQRRGPDAVDFQTAELVTKEGRYALRTTVSFRLEGENLVCRLSIDNQSKNAIDRVTFPVLGVPRGARSAESLIMPDNVFPLRMLFSQNDIRTDHNPFDALDPMDRNAWVLNDPKVPARAFNYPMMLATAWATYASDGRGIGFDVHDRTFQYKKLIVERRLYRDTVSPRNNRSDYELSWQWFPVVSPGASWQSPEIYLRFDDGDWHAIAGQHRDFLKTWVRKPDVAKEFQSSLGWISRGAGNFDELPAIAKQGVDVGAPYFIVYNWSAEGAAEMAYGTTPTIASGGLESLKRNLKQARELGSHPMAWFNTTLSGDSRTGHMLQGKDWVAKDRWGGGVLDGQWSLFNSILVATLPINEAWLQFDPSGAKDLMVDSIRRFIEGYGFSGFEMDQSMKYYLSYRDTDKIQPGMAYAEGYADFYKRAIEIVRSNDPEGIIVGEGVSDFVDQYVDSAWIFEGGALNVPTLTRWRYSLPWVVVPVRAEPTNLGHASTAFLFNAPLNIFDDLTKYTQYAGHLRRLSGLKKLTSQYFYQGDFADREGFSLAGAGEKAVLARSYRSRDGKFLAVVVVNPTDNRQEVTLKPDAAFASRSIRHFYLDGNTENANPSGEVSLRLAAADVQVVSFETP
ncbi:MAG: hypothetical protein LAP38_05470 [Acidobacteriia bacterium]|nr:hypothetical protein [Terriglobia bacterium]